MPENANSHPILNLGHWSTGMMVEHCAVALTKERRKAPEFIHGDIRRGLCCFSARDLSGSFLTLTGLTTDP
jgi:hypothetical protein